MRLNRLPLLRIIMAGALACALGVSTRAHADNLADAKAAFSAGKQAYDRGDYETALQQFQRANQLQPAASLSYNIGKTYENLGRYGEAADWFQRSLEQAGAPQTDDDRKFQDNLKLRIQALRTRGQQPQGGVQAGAQVQVGQTQQYPQYQQPQQQYPQYQQQPPAAYGSYYGNGYYQYQMGAPSPAMRMAAAQRKLRAGISLIVSGVVIDLLVGIPITVAAFINWHDGSSFGDSSYSGQIARPAVLGIGIVFDLVGVCLWAPGAALTASGSAELARLRQEQAPRASVLDRRIFDAPRTAGVAPSPAIFSSPVFHF